ncbi:MAG: xylitol dehydrogenase [Lasallia pustulata]|uniref:D-xylulose reductase n=1 Tax=Lasallia pustulata TaxID=136370 RepID=A0A5M8Q212_9LECA|nr:MAG: xylitol dehydrogenase [Lasallia pustulata]
MAEQNLSFVLEAPYKVKFEDRPIPDLQSDHDVLVTINWTGICGSDVHYWTHGAIGRFILQDPMVLGHESAGTITRIGSSVTTLQVGDHVALEPGVPCRRCARCKAGQYNLCADMAFAATPPYNGTLAKYYALPEDFCYKLPAGMTLEEGALVEPLSVAVHISKQGGVKPGDTVVVLGAGPVGLLCCAVARAFGAVTVVSVDIQEHRLQFAKEYAATGTFMPEKGVSPADCAARLIAENGLGGDGGADVVIDASGAEASVQTGIQVARVGGTYVQGGMGKNEMVFPIMEMCTKELNVRGSFRYGSGDYKLAVELVASGRVSVKELITRKVGFREAEKAFEDVKGGKGIKILIGGVEA